MVSVSIRKKKVLIVLLASLNLLAMSLGFATLSHWITTTATRIVRTQVLDDNEQIARQMAHLIVLLRPQQIVRGGQDWNTLQSLVEEIHLPNDGFLCIIDSHDGQLLCHPDLRRAPDMMSPAMAPLNRVDGTAVPIMKTTGSGWAIMPDGNHLIAVHEMTALGVRILAHQKERGLQASVAHLTIPLRWIGAVVAIGSSVLVGLAAVWVVSRYECLVLKLNDQLEETVRRRTRSLMKTRNAVIFGLAKLAESRDTDTGDHLDRIRIFVMLLARELRKSHPWITHDYIENLGLASSLHDIGKVGIPDNVLLKPGRLTTDERSIMETHARIGADCLAAIGEQLGSDDFLATAHEIALGHHEKYDGSGYPARVIGETIPLSARIVALADVYDALVSPRVYKRPYSHEEAKEIILRDVGTHFDPVVVDAFLSVEAMFGEITSAMHRSLSQKATSSTNPQGVSMRCAAVLPESECVLA